MSVMDEFVEWNHGINDDFRHIGLILQQRLSDEPEELIGDLQDAEAWNSRCQALLAQANSWLDRATHHLMTEKGSRTDFERKAELGASIAPIRLVRDVLEGFCEALKQRLILGSSLVGYHRQFVERKASQGYEPAGIRSILERK